MKFFRMSNGDIVTSLRPVTGTPGVKATRVYDAKGACYCFEERVYRGSLYNVQHQLKKDPTVCLTNQLNKRLKAALPTEILPELVDKPWYEDLKNRALGLLP